MLTITFHQCLNELNTQSVAKQYEFKKNSMQFTWNFFTLIKKIDQFF